MQDLLGHVNESIGNTIELIFKNQMVKRQSGGKGTNSS